MFFFLFLFRFSGESVVTPVNLNFSGYLSVKRKLESSSCLFGLKVLYFNRLKMTSTDAFLKSRLRDKEGFEEVTIHTVLTLASDREE